VAVTLIGHYPPPVMLEKNSTLLEALLALDYRGVRHAVVVDSNFKPEGMLTLKHIMKAIADGVSEGSVVEKLQLTSIREVMETKPPTIRLEELNPLRVIDMIRSSRAGAVAVVNGEGRIVGIVSEKHIAGLLATARTLVAVSEVMTRNVCTQRPNDTIADAIRLMAECWCRHLPVVSDEGKIEAVVTARDVVSYMAEEEVLEKLKRSLDPLEKPAKSIAQPRVVTVEPNVDLAYVLRLMRRYGVSGIPVVDSGALRGIVTERDVIVKPVVLSTVSIYYSSTAMKVYVGRIVA